MPGSKPTTIRHFHMISCEMRRQLKMPHLHSPRKSDFPELYLGHQRELQTYPEGGESNLYDFLSARLKLKSKCQTETPKGTWDLQAAVP